MNGSVDVAVWNPRVGTADAGGTETFLRNTLPVIDGLDDVDVTLYTGDGDLHPEVRGLQVCRRPWLRKEDRVVTALANHTPVLPAEIESATMLLRSLGVLQALEGHDVVSTHYYADALVLSRVLETPVVFRFPGIKHPSVRWRALLEAGDVETYVANSHATATRLREWFGVEIDEVIHPGVDTEAFTPATDGTDWSGLPVVLFVGRLDDGKGVPDLIRAHGRLGTDAELVIIGDGTNRPQYERLADRSERADLVRFVGRVEHGDMPQWYADADVFCLPSVHEGFPITVLEALASGTPVVASDIDAIREQVTDGVTGTLVEPGRPGELADAIDATVSATEVQRDATSMARDTARTYGWGRQARALAGVYRRTAEGSRD